MSCISWQSCREMSLFLSMQVLLLLRVRVHILSYLPALLREPCPPLPAPAPPPCGLGVRVLRWHNCQDGAHSSHSSSRALQVLYPQRHPRLPTLPQQECRPQPGCLAHTKLAFRSSQAGLAEGLAVPMGTRFWLPLWRPLHARRKAVVPGRSSSNSTSSISISVLDH